MEGVVAMNEEQEQLAGFTWWSPHDGDSATTGSGRLYGPDGSYAGLHWEMSDSPYIMKLEGPSDEHWGVYQVGFTQPVRSEALLYENLRQLLPRLQVLYRRARGVC
jgi:hypothetical protein